MDEGIPYCALRERKWVSRRSTRWGKHLILLQATPLHLSLFNPFSEHCCGISHIFSLQVAKPRQPTQPSDLCTKLLGQCFWACNMRNYVINFPLTELKSDRPMRTRISPERCARQPTSLWYRIFSMPLWHHISLSLSDWLFLLFIANTVWSAIVSATVSNILIAISASSCFLSMFTAVEFDSDRFHLLRLRVERYFPSQQQKCRFVEERNGLPVVEK